jgi:hypothetical protein
MRQGKRMRVVVVPIRSLLRTSRGSRLVKSFGESSLDKQKCRSRLPL